jgi:hypothetical protein
MRDPKSGTTFPKDIAPNLIGYLEREHFFKRLSVLFCPLDESKTCVQCQHNFEYSIRILQEIGMDPIEIDEVIAVLESRGGCCDCEILFNIVEEGRLKAEYWKSKASELNAS